jgi:signal transduction histidine kinase
VDGAVVLALVDDATQAARAEEELARTRRALARSEALRTVGEIASGVVHDLANLLAAMQMRMVLMERDSDMTDAQREKLTGLTQILNDGSCLLTRLQDFSRTGQDRRAEPLDLAVVIREAVEMVCASVTEKAALAGTRISIILKLEGLAPVMGIAAELRQLFINLLLNARDAMPRGGNIEISARLARDCVVLTVEDEGSGVPPELRDRIFDPFFTTKGRNGTGLGLSMARDLMKRQGGQITVANRRKGGAVFTLRFPVAASSEP